VKDTREGPHKRDAQLQWPGPGIWRHRECLACGHTFNTREYIWPPLVSITLPR